MSAEDAYQTLEDIASINGLLKNLKRIAPTQEQRKQTKEAGEIKRHYERTRKNLHFLNMEFQLVLSLFTQKIRQ